MPRATSTPPPTIGYSTLAPNEYPAAGDPGRANRRRSPDTTLLSLLNQVDAGSPVSARLMRWSGCARAVSTRPRARRPKGIDAAANYVLNQFNQIRDQSYQNSFSVLTQDFPINWDDTQSTGKNIIGVLQGTEVGGGVIVLGAHYDSIYYNFDDSAAYAPGANDDASGIAALLEIARIMSQRRHRATIMFVAFSAEEIQRTGSKAFVSDYLRANNINVDAMLNMDIIGSSTGPDGVDQRQRDSRVFGRPERFALAAAGAGTQPDRGAARRRI